MGLRYKRLSHRLWTQKGKLSLNVSEFGESGAVTRGFFQHLADIRHNRYNKSEVARHFNLNDHSVLNFNVCGLTYCANTVERKIKESNIIGKLGCMVPLGLNKVE